MKRFLSILVAAALSVGLMTVNAGAAALGSAVQVNLPTFPVTLNGQSYDSQHSEYPLIVYSDITYIPMTYYGARWLGLTTTWDQEAGLGVDYRPEEQINFFEGYPREEANAQTDTAIVVPFPVTVNGYGLVDNSMAAYPLLLYRDITYFPLTWAFCVDEFGWTYGWDPENGLRINAIGGMLEHNGMHYFVSYGPMSEPETADGVTYEARRDISLRRIGSDGLAVETISQWSGSARFFCTLMEDGPDLYVHYGNSGFMGHDEMAQVLGDRLGEPWNVERFINYLNFDPEDIPTDALEFDGYAWYIDGFVYRADRAARTTTQVLEPRADAEHRELRVEDGKLYLYAEITEEHAASAGKEPGSYRVQLAPTYLGRWDKAE